MPLPDASHQYHALTDREGRHLRHAKAGASLLLVLGLLNLIGGFGGVAIFLLAPELPLLPMSTELLLVVGLALMALGLPNTLCPAVFLKRHPLGRGAMRVLFGLNIILSFLFAPFVLFNVFGELVSQLDDFLWILILWGAWTWMNLYGIRLSQHPEVLQWCTSPRLPSGLPLQSASARKLVGGTA